MSAWPDKFVIGLTGNIATGKSVVRKMLEHLGAFGIDADSLAHRAIAPGSLGYQPVIETFGNWILDSDNKIDRSRLGSLVFAKTEALSRLEAILHPLVGQAIDQLICRARQKVIVVEAIKLLESSLAAKCDTVWVSYSPPELQLARLRQKRNMTESLARQRIAAQPPQEEKLKSAQVVIRNEKSFEAIWQQVNLAWEKLALTGESEPIMEKFPPKGGFTVQRTMPNQAEEISKIINVLSNSHQQPTREDIMANFAEKAFLLLRLDGKPVGIAGWKVENLVSQIDSIYLDSRLPLRESISNFINEAENASLGLQCEISLLFLQDHWSSYLEIFQSLGYQPRYIESLEALSWQEAAQESMSLGSILLFKQLRQDRILRSI